MHSLIQFSREFVAGAGGAVWCACGSVGSTGPTVLPIRKEPLALAYDPLDNRKREACGWGWGPYGMLVKAREMPGGF